MGAYQEHRESAETKDVAWGELENARDALAGAEKKYQEACALYEAILDESRTGQEELIPEAYGEYRQALQERGRIAADSGDFETATEVYRNLTELKKAYEGDKRIFPEDLRETIEQFLARRSVTDMANRTHFVNRGRYLHAEGVPHDTILMMFEKEITDIPKAIAKAPWTGFHRKT